MELPAELEGLLHKAKGLTADSREVREGFLFFAVKGSSFDGHEFIEDAVRRGAIGIIGEREIKGLALPYIRVRNVRKTLALSAHLFYGKPSHGIKVVGITGTNGKTSVTYILESILRERGESVGVIGTVNYRLGGRVIGEGRTTPDPVSWHRVLREMKEGGAGYVVAEVSSHALDQFRVWGTLFQSAIFTNLTRDHLDYHRGMEDYFRAKRRLFLEYRKELSIINGDDPYGKRLLAELGSEALSYGREGDVKIKRFKTSMEGSEIEVEFRGKRYAFKSSLVGDFQAYNLCAAIAYALYYRTEPEVITSALRDVYIPGRFEVLRCRGGFWVVVDYAHTPDAMDNVLGTVRKLSVGRVITLFGAGGNRDRDKRPMMGEVAERWSDLIFLTSDNPRDEDPLDIIAHILAGIKDKRKVTVIPDREEAIGRALSVARGGDVVAILGKGHETYQEIKGTRRFFSDKETVRRFLRCWQKG